MADNFTNPNKLTYDSLSNKIEQCINSNTELNTKVSEMIKKIEELNEKLNNNSKVELPSSAPIQSNQNEEKITPISIINNSLDTNMSANNNLKEFTKIDISGNISASAESTNARTLFINSNQVSNLIGNVTFIK